MAADESHDDRTQTHIVLTKGTMVSHYRIVEKIGAVGKSFKGKWTDNEIRDLDGYESVIDERADSIYRQDFLTPIGETEEKENEE